MFSKDVFTTVNKKQVDYFKFRINVKEFILTLFSANQPVLTELPSYPQLNAEVGHQRKREKKTAFAKE